MTKYKATWKLYSARRRVTLESLVRSGRFTDYDGYLMYCESLQIEPMTRDAFSGELEVTSPSPLVEPPSLIPSSPLEQSADPEELTATVWLAGVTETSASSDDTKKKSHARKKKDSAPGEDPQE